MTEDEAKTKWCPQYRVAVAHDHTIDNRLTGWPAQLPRAAMCLGSECMAWRWDGEVIWSEMSRRWLAKDVPEGAKTNAGLGHCGLAGRP